MTPADVEGLSNMVPLTRLRSTVGERYFARHEAYFEAGAVGSLWAYDYGCDIEAVIEILEDFPRNGEAEKVTVLAELKRSLGHVDDPDGRLGGLLDRLQSSRCSACRWPRSGAPSRCEERWDNVD